MRRRKTDIHTVFFVRQTLKKNNVLTQKNMLRYLFAGFKNFKFLSFLLFLVIMLYHIVFCAIFSLFLQEECFRKMLTVKMNAHFFFQTYFVVLFCFRASFCASNGIFFPVAHINCLSQTVIALTQPVLIITLAHSVP